jgi:RHS repeat-associated protein
VLRFRVSLDYFGARYYTNTLGRFTSPDPLLATPAHLLNPQKWNKDAYVMNNPLSLTDASGLDAIDAILVNFSKEIPRVGHEGIVPVHADGTARYARLGPVGGNSPSGGRLVQSFTLSTKVQFNADGIRPQTRYQH